MVELPGVIGCRTEPWAREQLPHTRGTRVTARTVIRAIRTRLRKNPARTIWEMESRPVPYTMALGGVATGIMKAQLAAMATGTVRTSGWCPTPMAREAATGRNAAAVAVLLVISVRKTTTAVTVPMRTIVGQALAPLNASPIQRA